MPTAKRASGDWCIVFADLVC